MSLQSLEAVAFMDKIGEGQVETEPKGEFLGTMNIESRFKVIRVPDGFMTMALPPMPPPPKP